MTKIALCAVAILVATGSAFAGSDHYGSNNANQPVAAVDHAFTASIRKPDKARHADVDTMTTTAPAAAQSFPSDPGQGIWGN